MKQSDNPRRMISGAYIYYNHWLVQETDEFNIWWDEWYGLPEIFGADDLETNAADDYYIRKTFALAGWLQAKGKL